MRRQEVTFRVVKFKKHAIAVAICALTGTPVAAFSATVDVNLGSSWAGAATSSGDQFFTNTFTTGSCNGSAVTIDAFLGNQTYTCPAGGSVSNTGVSNNNVTRNNEFGQIVNPNGARFGLSAGDTVNNVSFGLNVKVDAITLGTSAFLTGNGTVGNPYVLHQGNASAPAADGIAISLTSDAYFYGGNTITGSTTAQAINILGSGVQFNGAVTADNGINVRNAAQVTFRGDVTGNIDMLSGASAVLDTNADVIGNINFNNNNASVTLVGNNTITGSITAGVNNSTLTVSGNATVTGGVGALGAPNAPIGNVHINGGGSLVQFNTVSGNTSVNHIAINAPQAVLQVNGNLVGDVSMNGNAAKLQLQSRSGTTTNGMFGTLDFGTYGSGSAITQGAGTLEVGNNVSLTLGLDPATSLVVTNANSATMILNGNNTVSGSVGSARSASDAFNRIWAGAANGTVTFANNIYLYQGASGQLAADNHTGVLRVGSGTVNLQGNLYGNLVIGSVANEPRPLDSSSYSGYGNGVSGTWTNNGTVNISDNKTVFGTITTNANETGILNFLGSSAYTGGLTSPGQIGASSSAKLYQVTFNSQGTNATSTISNHVYASQVRMGHAGANSTMITLARSGDVGDTIAMQLGDAVTLFTNTTLNLDSTFGVSGAAPSALNFTKDQSSGRLLSNNTIRSVIGGSGANGSLATANATLNFVADAGNTTLANGNFTLASSSRIDVKNSANANTGNITLSNGERYNIAYLGSVANNQTLTLVSGNVTAGSLASPVLEGANLRDNSFVIDSAIQNGSIQLLASRDDDQYITKSNTSGHFSNPAALRFGTLAASGANYSSDMQAVFNKLDIDQWGYGNNEANLANQVKRLAPIVNGSEIHSAYAATSAALSTVSERLAVMRGDVAMAGTDGNGRQLGSDNTGWAKLLGGFGRGGAIGEYDGYRTSLYGLAFGFDTKMSNGVVGLMAHLSNTNIKQKDFREGDSASLRTAGIGLYATQEFGAGFVEGNIHYSAHRLDAHRSTVVGRTANSDVDYRQATGRLAAGYRLALDQAKTALLTPFAAVEAGNLKQSAYAETDAGAAGLEVDSRSISRTKASVGLKFNGVYKTSDGATIYPEILVAGNSYSGLTPEKMSMRANFIGDLNKVDFTTVGVTPQKSSGTFGINLRYATSRNSEMRLGYSYEGNKNLNLHEVSLKASWIF